MQNFETQVVQIKPLTSNVVEIMVELVHPQTITFEAGQFMQFAIGDLFRAYSIVTTPEKENRTLRFAVKLLEDGVGSNFVRGLKVGDLVHMRGALGILTIKDIDRDYCLIANGVGVAPFVSKLNDLLRNRGYKNKITLVFGVRSEADIFYADELIALAQEFPNFEFIQALSKPTGNWNGYTGRVTQFTEERYEQYRDRFYYLCGSQAMVADVRAILLGKGHDPKSIKIEIFT